MLSIEVELRDLLVELADVQQGLLDLLSEKRTHAAAGRWEALTQTQTRHDELLGELERLHERRLGLLARAAEAGHPSDSLTTLADRIELEEPQVKSELRRVAARMRLLQHESLTAWVVTQRSLLHLTHLLEILATGGRLRPTYGRETLPVSQGTYVDHEA